MQAASTCCQQNTMCAKWLQGEHSPSGALAHISAGQLLTRKSRAGCKTDGCAHASSCITQALLCRQIIPEVHLYVPIASNSSVCCCSCLQICAAQPQSVQQWLVCPGAQGNAITLTAGLCSLLKHTHRNVE